MILRPLALEAFAGEISGSDIFDEAGYLSSVPQTGLTDEEAVGGVLSFERLMSLLSDAVFSSTGAVLAELPGLVCVILLGAVCQSFSLSAFDSKSTANVSVNLVIFIYLFRLVAKIYTQVIMKLEELGTYALTLSGVMVSFMSFESQISGAGIMNSFTVVLSSFLSFVSGMVMPFVCAALIVTSVSEVSGTDLRSASGMLTGTYMTVFGGALSILSLIVSFQTKAAAGADSVIRRGAKIASAYAIPVVGGALSESFDNISLGLSVLKNSFGLGAALLIVLSVLPCIVSVIIYRLVFSLLACFCDISGTAGIVSVLKGLDALFSVMLITLVLNAVSYLYALFLFCGVGS